MIEWGAAQLQPYIHPFVPGTSDLFQYYQVSHSLGIILFGLLGAVIGRLVAPRDDRPESLIVQVKVRVRSLLPVPRASD